MGTAAVETKREPSCYYKTFVESGRFPVNGFEMYYEVHGAGKERRWSRFRRSSASRIFSPR